MSAKILKKLKEIYTSLSPFEKSVLQLYSIIYEPLAKTHVLRCIQKSKIRDDANKTVTSKSLTPVLKKLQKYRFLESGERVHCSDLFVEEAMHLASAEDSFQHIIEAIQTVLPAMQKEYYSTYPESKRRCIREIRIGIYQRDEAHIKKYFDLGQEHYREFLYDYDLLQKICNNPFRPEWFCTLPISIQIQATGEIVYDAIFELKPIKSIIQYLRECQGLSDKEYGSIFRDLLATSLIICGEWQEAQTLMEKYPQHTSSMTHLGWIDFLTDKNDSSIQHYQQALTLYRKNNRSRKIYFSHFNGLFFILALLKTRDATYFSTISSFISAATGNGMAYHDCYSFLNAVICAQQNHIAQAKSILFADGSRRNDSLSILFKAMATFWAFPHKAKPTTRTLETTFEKASKHGFKWLAMEIAALLSRLYPKEKSYKEYVDNIQEETGMISMLPMLKMAEEWERSLQALAVLNSNKKRSSSSSSRLIWLVDFKHYDISPREQTITAKGDWTKGRKVALKRIKAGELGCMTPQDHRIGKAVKISHDYYRGDNFYIDTDKAIPAIVGHPLLFLENAPTVAVELVKEEPEILVENKGDGFEIKFSVKANEAGIDVIKETPTRYKLIEITEIHRTIAETLGRKTLKVPASAKDKLLKAISNVSSVVTVHSAIGGEQQGIATVPADPRIFVHLLPIGNGFKLELFVKPFSKGGPYFTPGSGGKNVMAVIDEQRLQTERDLKDEKKKAKKIISACPTLRRLDEGTGDWLFDESEDCLQVLLELGELKDDAVIEWPEGKKLEVSHQASFEHMSLRINKEQDWFAVSGELKLDDSTILDMRRLLEMVDATPGRFLPLGENRFMALTQEFRKRLEEVNAYTEKNKKGLRFHPLTALAIEDFADSVKELHADKSWQAQKDRIKKSREHQPAVPSTLQAELRDYQIAGFQWLSQLAIWGVGACLADDMGLGKTLQALTLILERTHSGPTLVVAPASVTLNWIREGNHFAPTLNMHLFGGKERKKILAELKAFDVLVCSFGLLQQEAEMFSEIEWEVIVLDEAQAIKNVATKRSKAAMQLQGNFKMITTGTPIENHLGELWNLFRFINPGLLGSLEQFNKRFATPIEKYKEVTARKQLKKLIQPFILRRIKSQVLEELPPKTEITLSVELSKEENAFYEALRQKAVENLHAAKAQPGERYLRILAEIMKLRRACCHSSLAMSGSEIESSKLNLFTEVVQELLENRHKALVFSQFVDHLSILRKRVESLGISYQYLDGSTPTKKRQERVDAFQNGEGDLFLISLKAGGLGLNLTAADYVIHMDPWWNPAVEDQASDRAHRIGQQHPVTIYRLVTKNTIEEKIVTLHHAKRDLAESLLDGSDMTGKMSSDKLLELIMER